MRQVPAILHPTDFSDVSEHAFRIACALARDRHARLLVLHVVPPPRDDAPQPQGYAEKAWEELRRMQDPRSQVRVEVLLREGDPATVIPAVAAEFRCEVIVMGTHAWARGERLLMGSVAHSLFSTAPCLLLIVRPPFPTLASLSEANQEGEAAEARSHASAAATDFT